MEKICFILPNYFKFLKGGAELQAYVLAKKLSEKYEVHYIFESSKKFFDKKVLYDDGLLLHPIKRYRNKIFGKLFFLNFKELLSLIDDINPDIIYQRGAKPYLGILSKLWNRNNKKLILGISMDLNCSKKEILNLDWNFFSLPSKIFDSFFYFTGVKNADIIISQNKHQQKLLKENFNRSSFLISNGLPLPEPPFNKKKPLLISWIANIKPIKKPEIFINLAEKCKDLDVKFVYAGRPSKNNYQKILIKQTEKLQNLEYLGEIPFKETNRLLSKSSLLINTSETEGFSNTFIQAWLRETPVITLNCDPDDIIKNNEIGFHSGNFEKLVKQVRFLIENESLRNKMGKKARSYAIEHHDINKIVSDYLDTFNRLIDE